MLALVPERLSITRDGLRREPRFVPSRSNGDKLGSQRLAHLSVTLKFRATDATLSGLLKCLAVKEISCAQGAESQPHSIYVSHYRRGAGPICVLSEVIANVLVLTQLRYAAHGVSYVVVSSENNFDLLDIL